MWLLPSICQDVLFYFAADNTDFINAIPNSRNELQRFVQDLFHHMSQCTKFKPAEIDVDLYKRDCIWLLTKSLNKNTEVVTPTWAAFNSLITDALPIIIYCSLPLYLGPPTDWRNLYETLNICLNISADVTNCKCKL